MLRRSKYILPIAATALLLLAQAAQAVPLPGNTGGFGIVPARRYVVSQPGIQLTPTTVINQTSSSYRVSVFPAIVTQDLSGAFDFADTPLNLNNSRLVLSASPGGFILPPGTTHQVSLRWNLLPRSRKWIAMGVVFQGVAEGQTSRVHTITRLLSLNFLSLPGLNDVKGVFTGVFAQELTPRALQVVARVENTGNTFGAPSDGRLVIRDSLGNVVYSAPWAGDVVLPEAQRDFPINVQKLLPAGSYTATVTMRFGREQSMSSAFSLVGPNQLPTPAIAIRGFNATGVVGSAAHVTAQIVSDGTAPATLTLHLFLAHARSAAPGANALASGQVSYAHLRPGTATRLSRPLGEPLHQGSYRVFAAWTDATGQQHTLEASFTTTASRSLPQIIWAFIRNHLLLWLGLLLLALLIALAEFVRRTNDRSRRIEAELALTRRRLEAAELGDADILEKPPALTPTPVRSAPRSPRPKPSTVRAKPAASKRNRAEANAGTTKATTPRSTRAKPKTNGDVKDEQPSSAPANGVAGRRANGGKPNRTTTSGAKANSAKVAGPKGNGSKASAARTTARKASATKPTDVKPAVTEASTTKPTRQTQAAAKRTASRPRKPPSNGSGVS